MLGMFGSLNKVWTRLQLGLVEVKVGGCEGVNKVKVGQCKS